MVTSQLRVEPVIPLGHRVVGILITLEHGPDAHPEHLGIPRASELVHEPLQVLADGIGRRTVEEAPKGAEDTPQPATRDSHLVDGVGNVRPDQWVESTQECELADQVRAEDLRARGVLGRRASSLVVDVGRRLDLPDSDAHASCLGVGTCETEWALVPF